MRHALRAVARDPGYLLFATLVLGLYEVQPTDPLTFALASAVLLAVALVSGLVPAVRASRIDSARALRSA